MDQYILHKIFSPFIALITGASSGIGASTAVLFASCGVNTVLTARRADKLAEVKERCLAAYKVPGATCDENTVVVIEADMSSKVDLERVAARLEGRRLDMYVNSGWIRLVTRLKDAKLYRLVNNAGMVRGREHAGGTSPLFSQRLCTTNWAFTGLLQILVRLAW